MIKQAQKDNISNISTLIYKAIKNIANTLTGEEKEKYILETLDFYISQDVNRFSYNNIFTYEIKEQIVGIILVYNSNEVQKLDTPILNHLKTKNIFLNSFEKECFENEFYIDTISVDKSFQGRGIAKELLAYIEQKAKINGLKKLSLIVEINNTKALSLYEKLGFCKNTILEVSNHKYHHMIKFV